MNEEDGTNMNDVNGPDNSRRRLDQKLILDIYVHMYNSNLRQIERLYDDLNEIRHTMDEICSNILNTRVNSSHSNRTRYTHETQRNPLYYSPHIQYINRSPRVTYDIDHIIETLPTSRIFTNSNSNSNSNRNTRTNRNRNVNDIDNLTNLLTSFFENVDIYPSETQIQNATRVIPFGQIENPINQTCPISLDRFENEMNVTQILFCGHIFNSNEINEWFQTNVRCPVCRYDIRNYVRGNNTTADETTNIPTNSTNNSSTTTPANSTNNSSTTTPTNSSNNTTPHTQRSTRGHNRNRNVRFNDVESIIFDISYNDIINTLTGTTTNSLLDLFNIDTRNNRYLFDPSGNVHIFETYIENPNLNRRRQNQNQPPNQSRN